MTHRLWTIEDVAEYFGVEITSALFISAQPWFPKPIILPTRGTGARKQKRWDPDEVMASAKSQKAA